jgi:hypothetical protein
MIHNTNFIGLRNASLIVKSFEQDSQQLPSLDELRKGGEGSKGGHVIGHTSSGKPIYSHAAAGEYKNFTKKDHYDAALEHHQEHEKHNALHGKASIMKDKETSNFHKKMMNHHAQLSDQHNDLSKK